MQALICATCASPAMAEVVTCDLDGIAVRFAIDKAQFAPPLILGEPAQRRVTTVSMGNAQFPAEPILLGDVRGFWAEGLGGSEAMLVVQPDGSALFANPRRGERIEGTCEVQQ